MIETNEIQKLKEEIESYHDILISILDGCCPCYHQEDGVIIPPDLLQKIKEKVGE